MIRRLLFCVLKNWRFSGILPSSAAKQSFERDVRVRTKSHLPKDRGETIGPESAKESPSTRDTTNPESARESASG